MSARRPLSRGRWCRNWRDSVSPTKLTPTILEQDKFEARCSDAMRVGNIVIVSLDIICKATTGQYTPEIIASGLPQSSINYYQTVAIEGSGWARLYAQMNKGTIGVVSNSTGRFYATLVYPCD